MVSVTHLITGLEVGGAEVALCRLVRNLESRGIRNSVISLSGLGPIGSELQRAGIDVSALGMRAGRPSLLALPRLVGRLRRLRPDLLHCWMYHADLMGLVAGKLARVPRILWSIRAGNPRLASNRFLTHCIVRTCVSLSRFPDAIVCVSEFGRRLHHELGYDPSRMQVIPNGFDIQLYRPDPESKLSIRQELDVDAGTILIGMAARFHPVKDHKTFLRAAALLRQTHPEVRFVLMGEKITQANPDLVAMVQENRLQGAVYLLGRRDDGARVMASWDIASLVSHSEGFPNVVGEAMGKGCESAIPSQGIDCVWPKGFG